MGVDPETIPTQGRDGGSQSTPRWVPNKLPEAGGGVTQQPVKEARGDTPLPDCGLRSPDAVEVAVLVTELGHILGGKGTVAMCAENRHRFPRG